MVFFHKCYNFLGARTSARVRLTHHFVVAWDDSTECFQFYFHSMWITIILLHHSFVTFERKINRIDEETLMIWQGNYDVPTFVMHFRQMKIDENKSPGQNRTEEFSQILLKGIHLAFDYSILTWVLKIKFKINPLCFFFIVWDVYKTILATLLDK